MSAAPILQVEDVAVTYSQIIPALRGVSLTVPSGAIVALLGHFLLGEFVSTWRWIGIVTICVGVLFVGNTALNTTERS